jgi:hypothetical protein
MVEQEPPQSDTEFFDDAKKRTKELHKDAVQKSKRALDLGTLLLGFMFFSGGFLGYGLKAFMDEPLCNKQIRASFIETLKCRPLVQIKNYGGEIIYTSCGFEDGLEKRLINFYTCLQSGQECQF